jgi:hypothetical protein
MYTFLCCFAIVIYSFKTHMYPYSSAKRKSPTINQQLHASSYWTPNSLASLFDQPINGPNTTIKQICNFFNQLSCMGMIIAWVLVPYQAHSAHYLENKSTIVNFITINTYPLFFRMWSTSSFGSLG